MDTSVVDYLTSNFNSVKQFTTQTNTHYITGEIHGYEYMISIQKFYIITKRVDNKALYVSICDNDTQVIDILNKIKNKENIVPNEKAKLISSITGISTI